MCKVSVALFLCILSGVTFPLRHFPPNQQRIPQNIVNDILWWFPEDTETIMVTQSPFKVAPLGPDSPPTDLTEALRLIPLGPFSTLQNGKFYKQIHGQMVLCSIEASRRFRPPSRLGGSLYEGCTVTRFEPGFARIQEALEKSLQADAKQIKDISGYQVMRFEQKLEDDLWDIFVVFPQENLLLCATNEDFLRQTLNRMNAKGARRALSADLPEWKYVDTQAQCWGVRHYNKTDYALDESSPLSGERKACNVPDKEAVGLVFSYDPGRSNEVRIRYLSTNKDAVSLMKEYWSSTDAYQLRSKVQGDKAGANISFVPHDLEWLLRIVGALGYCVYV